VAVGADHLAFRDLLEDALPASVRERLRHIEALVAEVVELENDGVGLTAINARIQRKYSMRSAVGSNARSCFRYLA
jgi:hypothetical protein